MADETTTTAGWPEVSSRPDFPAMEQATLEHWHANDVFHKTLALRKGGPIWSFYEGPPTANGKPGAHHVEARVFKDVFPRYRAMKGHDVPRKAGWDCHGLPVELEVEKELGLNSKSEIEDYGIEAFNQRCRESVQRYVGDFEELTERIGFWVDMPDAYWTMDAEYVDSLWWALKKLWDEGLIFEDFRVAPYCARCGTGLSDAEVAMGYETVEDPSVFVRFPVLDGPLAAEGAKLVVWTTTPWTLPSNTLVAVNPGATYALVRADGELLVVAADLREKVLGEDAEVVREFPGAELVGVHYEAPITIVDVDEDYRYVAAASFVTTTDGSGLVHTAPAFGADDMELGRAVGSPVVNPVDAEGRFTSGPWAGRFVKDADPDITAHLRESGVLLKEESYEHTYPFCWRCKTPLIYWAKPSWYIRTTAHRDGLLANNAQINWHPEHIRDGRFGNWLENNVDWALSRDRYWGTPLPFWRCDDCGDTTVVASRAELTEVSGRDCSELDPHRPYVDEVTFPCGECGGTKSRVPHVADTWFDSGAMPFAQFGYPHKGHEEFEARFPAQFICEAIDQTRGWFYTLLAESTLLFDTSSYETCLCLGHIVDEDGQKMSKSRGNVIDPWELIDRHGADPLRWLMLAEGNPWVSRRVGHHLLEDVTRRFLLTLWNTHSFFTSYARLDGFALGDEPPAVADRDVSDRWILAELAALVDDVDRALAGFDVSTACRRLEGFVDDLSNWYVRLNRRRFWKAADEDPADKAAAYHTLHACLATLAGLLAPFMPFLADRLHADLVRSQDSHAPVSVHLTDFPVADGAWRDDELRSSMSLARRLVELGRQARNDTGLKTRQPLPRALVTVPEAQRDSLAGLVALVAEELNVKAVELSDGASDLVDRTVKPNFRALGPAFAKDAPAVGNALRDLAGAAAEKLVAELATGSATLDAAGAERTITPDMVEVVEIPKTGWQLAQDGAVSVALDTTLDDDLRAEGSARDLVRAINDERKGRGLALDDRIRLVVDLGSTAHAERLRTTWLAPIAREVLATDVTEDSVADGVEVETDGGTVRFRIES